MNKKSFQELAKLDKLLKQLQEQRVEMVENCLSEMKAEDVQQVKSEQGTFSIVERAYWRYSDKTFEEIKKLQQEDIIKGRAKKQITESLRFQAKNGNNKTSSSYSNSN